MLYHTSQGVQVDGRGVTEYHGIEVNMKDFSDQTLTLAAIAPFAQGETKITGIGHIRKQESDRLAVILTELQRMGIDCEELPEEEGICKETREGKDGIEGCIPLCRMLFVG